MNDPTRDFRQQSDVITTVDTICDAFRYQWSTTPRPPLEDYLAANPEPVRSQLLGRLVEIDWLLRLDRGEQPSLADYTSRFPDQSDSLTKLSKQWEQDATKPTNSLHATTVGGATDAGTDPTAVFDSSQPLRTGAEAEANRVPAGPSGILGPGSRFGDYDLLEKIAQGGMGVVYKARQVRLNRIVAVKMILAGQFADEDSVRRFYGEAEAAAKLKHPNIVAIHEVGEVDGQHFFSMDFIQGESLADALRENSLDDRTAAGYVQQIADAMSYAHDEGVLHRDLKPGNILLDANGHASITDFGLAKSTQTDSGLTATGQVLGTPSYMPPEQALGDIESIDARSDVYSIGAILYFTLTGRAPFYGQTVVDTIRQVIDREPVAPRQINPMVNRDIETICMKCLAKQPHRRYTTSKELSDELHRFLSQEPILARPVSTAERIVKWARRRPAVAGMMAVSVLAVLVTICVTLAFNAQLQTKNEALITSVASEGKQKEIAQAQANHAAKQSQLAMKTLASVIDDIQSQLVNVPAAHDVRTRLLKESIERLHEVAESLETAPQANRYLAEAHLQLGLIFLSIGEGASEESLATAAKQFEMARDVATKLIKEDENDSMAWLELSRSHEHLGEVSRQQGSVTGALGHYERALEISKESHAESESLRLYNRGIMHQKVGTALESMGRNQSALKNFETALALHRQAVDTFDGESSYMENALAFSHDRLGDAMLARGDPVAAQQHYETSFRLAKDLAERHPNDYRFQKNLATRYGQLSRVRARQNDREKAREYIRQALKLTTMLKEADPENASLQLDFAKANCDLAELEMLLGKLETADGFLKPAVETLESLAAASATVAIRSTLGRCYRLRGQVKDQLGDVKSAHEAFQNSLTVHQAMCEQDPNNVMPRINAALDHEHLGDIYLKLRDIQSAEKAFRTSLEARQALVDADPGVACNNRNLSVSYNKLVFVHVQMGDIPSARDAGKKGLLIAEQLAEASPTDGVAQSDLAVSLEYLGNVEMSANELKSARSYYERSAEIRQEIAEAAGQDAEAWKGVATIFNNLGTLSNELKDKKAAKSWYQKNLDLRTRLAEQDPQNQPAQEALARAYERMGEVYGGEGDHPKALEFFAKALSIFEWQVENAPENRFAQNALAGGLRRVGLARLAMNENDAALESLQRALTIAKRLAESDMDNVNQQLMLADIHESIGTANEETDQAASRKALEESLAIRQKLATAFPANDRLQQQFTRLKAKVDALSE